MQRLVPPGPMRLAHVLPWNVSLAILASLKTLQEILSTNRGGVVCGSTESLMTRRGLFRSPTSDGRLDGVKDASTAAMGAIVRCTVWVKVSS